MPLGDCRFFFWGSYCLNNILKNICSDVFNLLVCYFLLVRDRLIDEQALRTQYCFVWRDTGNSWSEMVSFLHDLNKFCFSLHILFVKVQ